MPIKTKLKIPEIALGVMLTIAIFAMGMTYESSHHGENYTQHKQAENSAAQVSPKSVTDERIADYTEALAWYTAFLAIATAGLLAATWFGVRSQIKDTRILQRAYLAVGPDGVDPFESIEKMGSDHAVAHIIVENVGHLPARGICWFINWEMSSDGRRSNFPVDESQFYGRNVIPPGTSMKRSQNCAFAGNEIKAFFAGALSLYAWGEVRYLDGFDKRRYTKFCHRYDRRGVTASRNPVAQRAKIGALSADSMRYHQYGNDAD